MFFKRKKEDYPLIFDEKKCELYLGTNKKRQKNKMGMSSKMLLLTIIVLLANYTYKNYFANENLRSEKLVYFGKFGVERIPTINKTDNTGKLTKLAKTITEGCKEEEFCKVKKIMTFIHKIPYIAGEGQAKTPIEVINSNSGDCDEKTYLFATLAIGSRLKPILIYAKKDEIYHAFIGIQLKEKRDGKMTYLKIDDKKYYYLETTGNENDIGKFNGYEKENIIGVYDEVHNEKISLKKITLVKDV